MISRRRPLRVGLSARIFHPEQGAHGIRTKTLQVLEQSVARWAASRNVLVLMVPSVVQNGDLIRSNIRLRDYRSVMPMNWNCFMNSWKRESRYLEFAVACN